MREKAKRVDTAVPASAARQLINSEQALSANPFAALHSVAPECLAASPAPEPPSAGKPAPQAAPPFRIARTKKGGWPLSVEKRGAGKTVTVVRNVSGDTEALLSLLKKRCAAGGKAYEDSVEIQGDHRDKIDALLRERGI